MLFGLPLPTLLILTAIAVTGAYAITRTLWERKHPPAPADEALVVPFHAAVRDATRLLADVDAAGARTVDLSTYRNQHAA